MARENPLAPLPPAARAGLLLALLGALLAPILGVYAALHGESALSDVLASVMVACMIAFTAVNLGVHQGRLPAAAAPP